MALYLYLYRGLHRKRNISINIFKLTNNACSRMLSFEVDSMDDFTTQLIRKKVNKWSTRKSVSKISPNVKIGEYSRNNISYLSITKINLLFQEAIEINDNCQVLSLIQQCISIKLCPTLSNLLYTLSVCSQNGDIATIKKIKELCEHSNPEILEAHSNFQHYVAEATWIKGNVQEALKLYKELYKKNTLLRRRIRLMLKNLVEDIVASRSEAVLVNVMNFAEELAREYKDYFPLTYIWQICFLSEWFSDQCIALDLLNKYEELRKTVICRIPYVVAVCLYNHQTDIVYRLLEIFLKFDMNLQYSGVLLALLDYQIHQKNLHRCLEIIQWSIQNDVQLLPAHYEKFLRLFIDKEDSKTVLKKIRHTTVPKTNFKF